MTAHCRGRPSLRHKLVAVVAVLPSTATALPSPSFFPVPTAVTVESELGPTSPVPWRLYSGLGCPVKAVLGAVKRILGKMEGVESFDVDIKEQKVTVKGNVTPDAILQTVSKTGKKTSYWEDEPVTQSAAPADATAAAS